MVNHARCFSERFKALWGSVTGVPVSVRIELSAAAMALKLQQVPKGFWFFTGVT